jgi:regulator of protease activity HflC (stomatin/prohibitin superfamily)
MEPLALILLVVAIAALIFWWRSLARTTIYDYQQGLLYRNGAFDKAVGPGTYRYLAHRTRIETFDLRPQPLSLAGQEILTKDNASVRVSLIGNYRITDAKTAMDHSTSYMFDLQTIGQLALREQVGALTLDELLAQKKELDARLLAQVAARAKELGLEVTALAVRDIMLPAGLKKAFAGVLEAQKEAQRLLEKARGEQAVLRSLANSSKMYGENPSLLQARVIQALASGNNSIVFGADDGVAVKTKR